MTQPDYPHIAKRMALPIPAPFKRAPKAQASWRTLKVGQYLTSKVNIFLPEMGKILPGTLFRVVEVDSVGISIHSNELTPAAGRAKLEIESSGAVPTPLLKWSNPQWRDFFDRVRKPKGLKHGGTK